MRRKTSRSTTRKMRLPKYQATFHALKKWYKISFEKLGWMVLADAKGYDYKVAAYKKSIDHLHMTLQTMMKEYENHNRLTDLKIMCDNLMVLKEHVRKDF